MYFALATLIAASISVMAISNFGKKTSATYYPSEVEALAADEVDSPFGTRFQTMGYCRDAGLTYACTPKWTSEHCRIYVCWY